MKKKILILIAIGALATVSFADNQQETFNEVVEERLELQFENKIGKGTDIDIEIANGFANVEVEVNKKNKPTIERMKEYSSEIANYLSNEFNLKNILISFELEKMFENDEILYKEVFKK